MRPQDVVNRLVICNATVDSYSDTNSQAALTAIRRVLRVEDWWVDTANHCIMPKNTGDYCYGGDIGTSAIAYPAAAANNSCINNSTTAVCPHFVSVCIRN